MEKPSGIMLVLNNCFVLFLYFHKQEHLNFKLSDVTKFQSYLLNIFIKLRKDS